MNLQPTPHELQSMDASNLKQNLRSVRTFVNTLLDFIHVGVCHVNAQGHIQSLNLEGARILQRTEQSSLGQSFHQFLGCLHKDPISSQEDCPITQVLQTRKSIWTPKLLVRRPNGETKWVEFQCTPLTDLQNPGALIIFRDLSQQLRQHEEHQHLASMPEESPNPIVEVDPQGRLTYANPAMIQLLDTYGFREDGIPEVLPSTLTQVAMECLKTLTPVRDVTVVVDHRHFDWTFSPIQELGLMRGYGLDITNHVQVGQSLSELGSQYHSLVDSAHEGIISADLHGTIVSWNPAAESIFGYQADHIIGQSILSLLEPQYRDEYQKGLQAISYDHSPHHDIQRPLELVGLRQNGETFPLEISLTSWKVGLDTHYGFILRDISERKQLEQSVVEEKDRLVTTLQSVAEGIITTDREGHISFMNSLAESMTGWSEQEALHQPLQHVLRITHESPQPSEGSTPMFSANPTVLSDPDTPHTLTTRQGEQRKLLLRETPIRGQHGHLMGTVILFRDITDQHRQQEEQQRKSKLNSLGVLAGGLAHDFNNLLTTILGNVFVAKLRIVPHDPLSHNLEQAEQACLRAKELTQQLLTFAKGGAPIKTSVALGDLLRKTTIFALSGSSLSCHFDIPDDLWPLDADAGQLRQVFQNITLNARQAMPEGGHFTVRVENVNLTSPSSLPISSLTPGHYLKIAFEDQGVGIDPQHLPNIFDPYFTTKSGGSGLGLATAHSIIQQHQGHISVESRLGKGTTITIFLPSSYATPHPTDRTMAVLPKGRGRILVMDDEASIRRMVQDALTQFGYEVKGTQDGQEAIDAVSLSLQNDEKFDVVLLDLTVPGGMGGKEAIHHLRNLDPDLRAVVTSGYSDDPIMSNFERYGFQGILVKPYKILDLAKLLESMLGSTREELGQDSGYVNQND